MGQRARAGRDLRRSDERPRSDRITHARRAPGPRAAAVVRARADVEQPVTIEIAHAGPLPTARRRRRRGRHETVDRSQPRKDAGREERAAAARHQIEPPIGVEIIQDQFVVTVGHGQLIGGQRPGADEIVVVNKDAAACGTGDIRSGGHQFQLAIQIDIAEGDAAPVVGAGQAAAGINPRVARIAAPELEAGGIGGGNHVDVAVVVHIGGGDVAVGARSRERGCLAETAALIEVDANARQDDRAARHEDVQTAIFVYIAQRNAFRGAGGQTGRDDRPGAGAVAIPAAHAHTVARAGDDVHIAVVVQIAHCHVAVTAAGGQTKRQHAAGPDACTVALIDGDADVAHGDEIWFAIVIHIGKFGVTHDVACRQARGCFLPRDGVGRLRRDGRQAQHTDRGQHDR